MGISQKGIGTVDPKDFARFDPIPPEGIARAAKIMGSGEIFRYCGSPGNSEVTLLERDIAKYVGARYALAVSSCSSAIQLAMAASGVGIGSKVLLPGFTFTAVPSAIVLLGAEPIFVECTKDYRLDIEDLHNKITSDTRVLLLSHMRGHISNMDQINTLCVENNVTLIEDAAHALGCYWRNKRVGTIGKIGCYSFQSNKIINTGEGGILVTDDPDILARLICMSGAYESNYEKHGIPCATFKSVCNRLPLSNARMTNVTAAMARPQIPLIDIKGVRFREMHQYITKRIQDLKIVEIATEDPNELRIPDSLQFRLLGVNAIQLKKFILDVRATGVPLVSFSEPGNARAFSNWLYLKRPDLPKTLAAISTACDMRLPSTLTNEHLDYLVAAIKTAARSISVQ